jgi:hypothetical protein
MTVPQILIDKVAEAQFVGFPDWEVATILNTVDETLPTKKVPVMTTDVRQVFLERQYWPGIVLTAENTAADLSLRGLCITVRDSLNYTTIIETHKPASYDVVVTLLTALVAANLIDATTKNDLLAMTNANQSWATYNQIYVDSRLVGLARGAVA